MRAAEQDSEVDNDGNDTGQLRAKAKAAKQALGAETLQATAETATTTELS